jgi:hypothetical protein
MSSEDSLQRGVIPLAGCRVIEHSRTVAAAYAGRLLAAMGATVVMLEPPEGSPLRTAPPLLDGTGHSALFALSVGRQTQPGVRPALAARSASAGARACRRRHPDRRHARCATRSAKAGSRCRRQALPGAGACERAAVRRKWSQGRLGRRGSEPAACRRRGLSASQRPLLRALPGSAAAENLRSFQRYQGGSMAAFAALSAWWAVPESAVSMSTCRCRTRCSR